LTARGIEVRLIGPGQGSASGAGVGFDATRPAR
jgi:hypothetical protein